MLRAFLEDEALNIERTFLRELSIKNQEVMIHLRKLKLAEQEKARLKVEVDFLKSRNQILDSKVLQLNVEQMISKEFDKFKNCKCNPKMEQGDQWSGLLLGPNNLVVPFGLLIHPSILDC